MIGRLYYDNNPKRSNLEKAKLALQLYIAKTGEPPSKILVNENMKDVVLDGIKTEVTSYIRPNYMLIGDEE